LRECVEHQAAIHGFQASVIAAIVSRESAWGLSLTPLGPAGTGDFAKREAFDGGTGLPPDGHGWGRGLMQIDYEWQEFAHTDKWKDPSSNIAAGCNILDVNRVFILRHADLHSMLLLRAVVSAYYCGPGNVIKALNRKFDVDHYTSGGNYSVDVMSRAGWFQLHGWI
jgi:hypothetical protein